MSAGTGSVGNLTGETHPIPEHERQELSKMPGMSETSRVRLYAECRILDDLVLVHCSEILCAISEATFVIVFDIQNVRSFALWTITLNH